LKATSERLFKRTFGRGDDSEKTLKKNGFRFPNDPEAEIPQAKKPIFIDRRAMAARTEILMKAMGTKKKNLIKQTNAKNLSKALKEAEDRAEGRERENEVIDMNKMVNFDEYGNIDVDQIDMENFTLNENSSKSKGAKKGNNIMDVDDGLGDRKRRNKKNRKNKSYYIVNY
jgi:hypothetical protein